MYNIYERVSIIIKYGKDSQMKSILLAICLCWYALFILKYVK